MAVRRLKTPKSVNARHESKSWQSANRPSKVVSADHVSLWRHNGEMYWRRRKCGPEIRARHR